MPLTKLAVLEGQADDGAFATVVKEVAMVNDEVVPKKGTTANKE